MVNQRTTKQKTVKKKGKKASRTKKEFGICTIRDVKKIVAKTKRPTLVKGGPNDRMFHFQVYTELIDGVPQPVLEVTSVKPSTEFAYLAREPVIIKRRTDDGEEVIEVINGANRILSQEKCELKIRGSMSYPVRNLLRENGYIYRRDIKSWVKDKRQLSNKL